MTIIPTITSTVSGLFSDPFELSCWFKHNPLILKKRIVAKQTIKGSFTIKTKPIYNTGDIYLEWSIEPAPSPNFVAELQNRYYSDELFTYNGIYGEEYTVEFSDLNVDDVVAGLFNISGKFRVLCIASDFDPTCPTP